MFWNITTSPRGSLLLAALAFLVLCFNVVVNKDCHHPNQDKDFHKSNCVGYEIAAHSVWTEMQCLDNCLRLPYCDKYIFDREQIPSCTLLYTGDIASAPVGANLKERDGKCRPKAFQDFLLGTEDCSHLYRSDDSKIMPREFQTTSNGGT